EVVALSAEQRCRLAIVTACAAATSILLLDECLAVGEPWIDAVVALIEGRRDDGTAIVLAERSGATAARLCNRVAELHDGRLIEKKRVEDGRLHRAPAPEGLAV